MNKLASYYFPNAHYPIPHADFLRLQHAHNVGVMFLDMLDIQDSLGHKPDKNQLALMASVVALLTDQLGKVVDTCESKMRIQPEDTCK
ncbi:hypothetical protein [Yersinia intermedia]|uniref:hypothetical protein n=1 Tax=Yersinia intermedia TaxID=631 RepID=UPI0005E439BF|nr:hypothetical protein [Yersinia intermedia]CNH85629.1 Uncharacterised protein [Yersinia intermedia]